MINLLWRLHHLLNYLYIQVIPPKSIADGPFHLGSLHKGALGDRRQWTKHRFPVPILPQMTQGMPYLKQ